MKIIRLTGTISLVLILVGCARSLEKGWKKEDEGKKSAAVKKFSRALIDSEKTYRKLAAEELIRIGEPAVPALTAVLLRKSRYYDLYYSGARKEAAWALGEIVSEEAVFPLLAALKTVRESYREEDLVSEVKDLNGRAQLARMVREITDRSSGKKDQITITKTIEKHLEEIKKVIEVVFEDEDSFYREEELTSAINRIELLPLSGKEGKKAKEETLRIIKEKLETKMSSGPPELIVGIEALGKIGDRRAVEFLLEMLEETYTRPEAALALARIGERKAIPFLEEAWRRERQNSIKVNLEAALYLMGDESKWEPLVERLRERKLRRESAELLGKIGDEKGAGPLVEALSDEREEVRGEAVKALKRIGGREAEEALLRALNDDDPGVRKEAIFAVVNSEKSGEALRKIVADEGEELIIRLAAASRLGEWGDRSGLPLAARVAKDKTFSDEEKMMAIAALGRIGEEKEVLGEIYQDREENYPIRFEARRALRTVGGRE